MKQKVTINKLLAQSTYVCRPAQETKSHCGPSLDPEWSFAATWRRFWFLRNMRPAVSGEINTYMYNLTANRATCHTNSGGWGLKQHNEKLEPACREPPPRHSVLNQELNLVYAICRYHVATSPLAITWGRTILVHSSSRVWAVTWSTREMVDKPTILWVLTVTVPCAYHPCQGSHRPL